MFKDADGDVVERVGSKTSLAPSAVNSCKRGEALPGTGTEHPGPHAAGEQRQGSEIPPCSRPARNAPRGRRMLRFLSLPVDAPKGADATTTQGHPASPALL